MFLLADVNMKVVFGIRFMAINNADNQFTKKKLIWKTYMIKKVFTITCQVEFINKNKFVEIELDENVKVLMTQINSLAAKMIIYPAGKTLVSLLLVEKVSVLAKKTDCANVISKESVEVLA